MVMMMMIVSRRVRFLVAVAVAASSSSSCTMMMMMMIMMIPVHQRESYGRKNDQRRLFVQLFGKHQLYNRWNGAGLQGWFGIRETRLSVCVSVLIFVFMFMFMFLSMLLFGGVKGRTWWSRLGHIVGSGCLGFCSDVVVLWGCIHWFGSCSFLIHQTLWSQWRGLVVFDHRYRRCRC
jgi:hypothetical protein